MKARQLLLAILVAAVSIPVALPVIAANDNPPGPAGGPGTNWVNPPGPAGGRGAGSERPHRRLTDEQRAKLKAMTPEQRQAFFQQRCEKRMKQRFDRGNNPPGPSGGPGTNWEKNWENPPGPKGGPGASPGKP